MGLTADDITRLAHLARIDIDAGEARDVKAKLDAILGLIDDLQSIDTSGMMPRRSWTSYLVFEPNTLPAILSWSRWLLSICPRRVTAYSCRFWLSMRCLKSPSINSY